MTIKENLTAKDVLERLEAMNERYAVLVKDIGYALGKLDDTKQELEKAKDFYEQSFSSILKKAVSKHPRFSICAILILISLCFASLSFFFQGKDLRLKTDNLDAEIKINHNIID